MSEWGKVLLLNGDAVVVGGLCIAAIVGTAWNWAQESIEGVLRRRNARKAWPKTFRAP